MVGWPSLSLGSMNSLLLISDVWSSTNLTWTMHGNRPFMSVWWFVPATHPIHPHPQDRISFNSAINACSKAAQWQRALGLLSQLKGRPLGSGVEDVVGSGGSVFPHWIWGTYGATLIYGHFNGDRCDKIRMINHDYPVLWKGAEVLIMFFFQTTQGVCLGAIWVMSGHERKKSRHYPGVGFYEGRRAETPYISLFIWPAKSSPLHQPRTKLYDFQIWINISTSFFGGWARINIHLHHLLYHSYFDHQEHRVLTSAGSPGASERTISATTLAWMRVPAAVIGQRLCAS